MTNEFKKIHRGWAICRATDGVSYLAVDPDNQVMLSGLTSVAETEMRINRYIDEVQS